MALSKGDRVNFTKDIGGNMDVHGNVNAGGNMDTRPFVHKGTEGVVTGEKADHPLAIRIKLPDGRKIDVGQDEVRSVEGKSFW